MGCVLALELAQYGAGEPPSRADVGAVPASEDGLPQRPDRLELLHRLDLADEIRTRGVPADHRADFCWTLGLAEEPVAVWRHPSVNELTARLAEVNDGTAPAEPHQRVSGAHLKELLREAAAAHPLIDLRRGWILSDLRTEPHGATATVVERPARSVTRFGPGSWRAATGRAVPSGSVSAYPWRNWGFPHTSCSVRLHQRRRGVPGARRGARHRCRPRPARWFAGRHRPVERQQPGATPTRSPPADPIALVKARLGVEFGSNEILRRRPVGGLPGRSRRLPEGADLLAGDAAHRFYPARGYGVNTASQTPSTSAGSCGHRQGWGGGDARQLRGRTPTGRTVQPGNVRPAHGRVAPVRPPPRGRRAREHLAGVLAQDIDQVDNLGVHFGYRHGGSPVVHPEDGAAPAWRWDGIVPTTWPGSRAPSLRLPNGRQLFDTFGREFTLVDLSGTGKQTTAELTQSLGRSPTPRELAESIGCTVEEIVEGIESSNAYSTLSLDAERRQRGRRRHDARRDRHRRRGPTSSTSRSASRSSRCSTAAAPGEEDPAAAVLQRT